MFHLKLGLVFVALVVEALVFLKIRSFTVAPGGKAAPLVLHIGAGLCLIGIVFAVKVLAMRVAG